MPEPFQNPNVNSPQQELRVYQVQSSGPGTQSSAVRIGRSVSRHRNRVGQNPRTLCCDLCPPYQGGDKNDDGAEFVEILWLPVLDPGGWGVHVPHGAPWAREQANAPQNHPRFSAIDSLSRIIGLTRALTQGIFQMYTVLLKHLGGIKHPRPTS